MRRRVPLALLLLVVGVVVGTASAVVHGTGLGITLALVATLAGLVALPPGWWSRLPYAAGWLAVVLYVSRPRPEGDYLVAADTRGYLLLGTGMVAVAVAVVTLRPRSNTAPGAVDSGSVGDLS